LKALRDGDPDPNVREWAALAWNATGPQSAGRPAAVVEKERGYRAELEREQLARSVASLVASPAGRNGHFEIDMSAYHFVSGQPVEALKPFAADLPVILEKLEGNAAGDFLPKIGRSGPAAAEGLAKLLAPEKPDMVKQAALVALEEAGPDAAAALPALRALYSAPAWRGLEGTTQLSEGLRARAARAAGRTAPDNPQPDAVAFLVKVASDPADGGRHTALFALSRDFPRGPGAVQSAASALTAKDPTQRLLAATLLIAAAPDRTNEAIPALGALVSEGGGWNRTVPGQAAALAELGPAAKAAAPAVGAALAAPPQGCSRSTLARALRRIDPDAAREAGVR
jgi:hypothetical protein